MLYRRWTRTGVVGHGARVRGRGAHRWKPAELSKQAIALHDVPTDQQQHMRSQHSTAVAARWRRGGGGGGGAVAAAAAAEELWQLRGFPPSLALAASPAMQRQQRQR